MIKWKFPDDRPFNVQDKEGTWCTCRLVDEDEETITIDYVAANNGARMRVQLNRESILNVSYPVSAIEALERSMNEPR